MDQSATTLVVGLLQGACFTVAICGSLVEPNLKLTATDDDLWSIVKQDAEYRAGETAFLFRDALQSNREKILRDVRDNVRNKLWIDYGKLAAVAFAGFLVLAAVFRGGTILYSLAVAATFVLVLGAGANLFFARDGMEGNPLLAKVFVARAVICGAITAGFLILLLPSARRRPCPPSTAGR